MKRIFALTLVLVLAFSLIGCAKGGDSKTVRIGASPTPHKLILEYAAPLMEEKGYKLEITEYQDYVIPNTAVESGELDANFFQHEPYMNDFNENNGTHLVSVAAVHYEPFGLYAGKTKAIADLADGATIIIPADDSNETRALLLLQQEGLIELPEGSSLDSSLTTLDVVDDHGYVITPVQADLIPSQLKNSDEGTIAIINGNYALAAGYTSDDALAYESTDSEATETYANVVAVRSGDENSAKIQALVKALQTDAVKQFINDTYKGSVVAYF